MRPTWATCVAAAMPALTAACGTGNPGAGAPTPPNQLVAASVQVVPSPLDLIAGATGTLVATARDAQGTVLPGAVFTWASQSSGVATVSTGGMVTAVLPGTTGVTATSGGISGAAVVNVSLPSLTLSVSPVLASTTIGGSVAFTVTARDANGVVQPTPPVTAWTSSNPAVATVSSGGVATGVAAGAAVIGAVAGSLVATPGVLTVTPLTLTVVPATATTTVGGTVPFTVIATDANGVVQTTPPVVWSVVNPAIATVSSGGIATGVAAGSTMIGARAGTLVATLATLNVTAPGRCDDIANRTTFNAVIGWDWGRHSTSKDNHEIEVQHRTNLASTLTRVSSVLEDEQTWQGPLSGSASDTDYDLNKNSQPATHRTIGGGGTVLTSVNGNPLPGVTLKVDLLTCTYRFETTPWIDMLLTEPDGKTERAPLPVGTLRVGWRPVGAWTQVGLHGGIQYIWDAHGILWLALPGNAFKDGYFPDGFGQLYFVKATNAMDLTLPGPSGGWGFR